MNSQDHVYARVEYKVTLEGQVYDFAMELIESGAQNYGNHTTTVMYCNGKFECAYDTRYETDCSSVKRFPNFTDSLIKNYVRPGCVIKRTKVETFEEVKG